MVAVWCKRVTRLAAVEWWRSRCAIARCHNPAVRIPSTISHSHGANTGIVIMFCQ